MLVKLAYLKGYQKLRPELDKIMDKFGQNIDVTFIQPKNRNILARIYGNHIITFATEGEIGYYLDPTLCRTYIMEDGILKDNLGTRIPIQTRSTKLFNYSLDHKKIKEELNQKNHSISIEKEKI